MSVRSIVCLLVGTVVCSQSRAASADSGLPHYIPRAIQPSKPASYLTNDGAVAILGYNDMQEMLESLNTLFIQSHPRFSFALVLKGTRTAPPGLARGASAFAPMGAEFSAAELSAYRAEVGGEPIMFRVAHASLNPHALSGPIGIFVHRSNPLASLAAEQIARVFTTAGITWGELGLTGEWATRAVHPCGLSPETALGVFMRDHAFPHRTFGAEFAGMPQSAEVVKHIGADPQAIGFAAANRGSPDVKLLGIAPTLAAEPVDCTAENIVAGRYLYDRHLLIYARRDRDGSLDPLVHEYLRLVLSREGQQAVAAGTLGYLPLNSAEVAAELAKLDHSPTDIRQR